MNSKLSSLEEKVKLPPTETISRFYLPQRNRKAIRILTVAVYVLCVSLAAIMLSLYYLFIWDPTIRPFVPKVTNCGEKIIIPEQIAIRLINSTEISAEQFYKNILDQYHIGHTKSIAHSHRSSINESHKPHYTVSKGKRRKIHKTFVTGESSAPLNMRYAPSEQNVFVQNRINTPTVPPIIQSNLSEKGQLSNQDDEDYPDDERESSGGVPDINF